MPSISLLCPVVSVPPRSATIKFFPEMMPSDKPVNDNTLFEGVVTRYMYVQYIPV